MKTETKIKILNIFMILYMAILFTSIIWVCNPNDFQVNLNISPFLAIWGALLGWGVTQ